MSDFGENFKRARQSSGLALEKIASETRISTRFLSAIENEEFHLLPGGVFNRGFIRSYAERVGLNPEDTLRDYDRISNTEEEPVELLRNVERASMRKSERSLYPIAAGLLLVLVIVFYVVTRNSNIGSGAEPAAQPKPAAATPAQTAPPVVEPPAAAPAIEPETATAAAAVVPTPPPAPAPTPTAALVLDVDVKDLSWIRVKTDGNVALSENMQPGSKQRFTATSSIDMMIGNAGGASVVINGRDVGALGKSGEVRQLTITPENAATVR